MERLKEIISGILFIFLLFPQLTGCARRSAPATPRPQASYLRWLEKQSMLFRAPEYINQVTQSGRVWLNAGSGERSAVLLAAAPEWALLFPDRDDFYKRAAFRLKKIAVADLKGVFFGQLGENLDAWISRETEKGSAGASLEPSPAFGSPEEFGRLLDAAEDAGLETGSDLPPAATGRGPDFILQARNAGGHQGLYAMLPLPTNRDAPLPGKGEWDATILTSEEAKSLADAGLLPEKIRRDELDWADAGWAAIGPVTGLDGQPRRWLYRFEKTPASPVLLWQDPSGAARQIMSAAIIRQTGLDGQTLLGIRAGAWMGLEPETSRVVEDATSFEPGIEAVEALARQIRQYGGWAAQADSLPPVAVLRILSGSCDFCVDDLTPLALARGLANQDSALLAALYGFWLKNGLPFHRLAHGMNAVADIPQALLNHLPKAGADEPAANRLVPGEPSPVSGAKADGQDFDRLFLAWALSLPGLVFINMDPMEAPEASDAGLIKDLTRARRRYGLPLATVSGISRPSPGTKAVFKD
ncbi:MAG: hypothetical protein K2H64_03375 [Desulfovibrio sp.]|nr:hypothetical protein [Desulfovibrio sp.]